MKSEDEWCKNIDVGVCVSCIHMKWGCRDDEDEDEEEVLIKADCSLL